MKNQWQHQYFLSYSELVANFPSPEKVVSDYIKHKFSTTLPWFGWADPDNLYLSDLLKAVVTINLIPDGIILVSMPLKR